MTVSVATRTVLLDSGGVLIRPVSGKWFPPPSVVQILTERDVAWEEAALAAACSKAEAFLDEMHAIPLTAGPGEDALWLRYYEILVTSLGLATSLGAEMQARGDQILAVEPYEWAEPTLTALRARGLRIIVVSNSWPGLRRVQERVGLARWIDDYVISAELGSSKPAPPMYLRALELAGCPAAETVFVDDVVENVVAAAAHGIPGFRLRLPGNQPDPSVREITDLRELVGLL